MAVKSTYLTVNNPKEQVSFDSTGLRCKINEINFTQKSSLEDREIKEVLNICKKYHASNLDTLIIKDNNILTIWMEETEENIPFFD